MNGSDMEKYENRNKIIWVILLSVAVILAFVYLISLVTSGSDDSSSKEKDKVNIITGSTDDNEAGNRIHSLIKKD